MAATLARTKYKYPNQYLTEVLLGDLYDMLKQAKVKDVVVLAEDVGAAGEHMDVQGRGQMTVYDMEACHPDDYADASGTIWFYGGPEVDDEDRFTMLHGTLLTWLMDRILFFATIRGPSVWDELRFDECSFSVM